MTTTLWDTNGTEIVKALAAERRAAGALASGLALTLVVVVDEKNVRRGRGGGDHRGRGAPVPAARSWSGAGSTPTTGSTPRCRSAAGSAPGEAVVMRMYGRLVAARRVGRAAAAGARRARGHLVARPAAGPDRLRPARRARRPPGDRLRRRRRTRWRRCAAGPRTTRPATPTWPGPAPRRGGRCWPRPSTTGRDPDVGRGAGRAGQPERGAAGRLARRPARRRGPKRDRAGGPGVTGGRGALRRATTAADRPSRRLPGDAVAHRQRPDRQLPLKRRELGDLLAEELRRLDADQPYAEALATATGEKGLDERPPMRDAHLARPREAPRRRSPQRRGRQPREDAEEVSDAAVTKATPEEGGRHRQGAAATRSGPRRRSAARKARDEADRRVTGR